MINVRVRHLSSSHRKKTEQMMSSARSSQIPICNSRYSHLKVGAEKFHPALGQSSGSLQGVGKCRRWHHSQPGLLGPEQEYVRWGLDLTPGRELPFMVTRHDLGGGVPSNCTIQRAFDSSDALCSPDSPIWEAEANAGQRRIQCSPISPRINKLAAIVMDARGFS